MPRDPHNPNGMRGTEDEYRRRIAAKARRRKKRRMQRIILLAAFAVAAVLLVICIIAIFKAIFNREKQESATSSSSVASIAEEVSLPTGGPGIDWPIAADPSVWNLFLVNGQHQLPEEFNLADDALGTISVGGVAYYFDARIVDSLLGMVNDCNAVEGHTLQIASGFRSADNQNSRYNYAVEYFMGSGQGQEEAELLARQSEPPAGYSEHQTGLAVDFVTGTVNEPLNAFAETPEFAWLVEHAAEYGFILRYPSEKEAITGIKVQPYHFRYVGTEDAQIITEAGICLEEYLAMLPTDEAESTAESGDNGNASAPQDAGSAGASDAGAGADA